MVGQCIPVPGPVPGTPATPACQMLSRKKLAEKALGVREEGPEAPS